MTDGYVGAVLPDNSNKENNQKVIKKVIVYING